MGYSTPVNQLIVSNIKNMDLKYRYDRSEDGKQCWDLLSSYNVTMRINYESNSTAAFLPVCKKPSESMLRC